MSTPRKKPNKVKGEDVLLTFSTVEDGVPLDFSNPITFQLDVYDARDSDEDNFKPTTERKITTITSAVDSHLFEVDADKQEVTVTIPRDRDPELDGGLAVGLHQYDPDFGDGKVRVYLSIDTGLKSAAVVARSRKPGTLENLDTAKLADPSYVPAAEKKKRAQQRRSKKKVYNHGTRLSKNSKAFSGAGEKNPEDLSSEDLSLNPNQNLFTTPVSNALPGGPIISNDNLPGEWPCYCYSECWPPPACQEAEGIPPNPCLPCQTPVQPGIYLRPLEAKHLKGMCSRNVNPRFKLTLGISWFTGGGAGGGICCINDFACQYAILAYTIRAWKPVSDGIADAGCPESDNVAPTYIGGGSVQARTCQADGGDNCGNTSCYREQVFDLEPVGSDGDTVKAGVPAFGEGVGWSRVKLDINAPFTGINITFGNPPVVTGSCRRGETCSTACCCPKLYAYEDNTTEFPWRVPAVNQNPLIDDADCCKDCADRPLQYQDCQCMYKGELNICSPRYGDLDSSPTFLPECDQDLYRVYWKRSDIYPCGLQYNFWIRATDIE
mgnify:CR=1 FL=1